LIACEAPVIQLCGTPTAEECCRKFEVHHPRSLSRGLALSIFLGAGGLLDSLQRTRVTTNYLNCIPYHLLPTTQRTHDEGVGTYVLFTYGTYTYVDLSHYVCKYWRRREKVVFGWNAAVVRWVNYMRRNSLFFSCFCLLYHETRKSEAHTTTHSLHLHAL